MPRRSKSAELLEFEVRFYEKLLTAYPDFIDVLMPLGHAYTKLGRYEHGLQVDLRLTQLRSQDPVTWYNLACSYSLLKRLDDSIGALRRAVELGYTDLTALRNDPDLHNLRQSPQYRQWLESCPALTAPKLSPRSLPAPHPSHPDSAPQADRSPS